MRLRTTGLTLLLTVAMISPALAGTDWRARAQKTNPDEAVALDGLLAEVTLLNMAVRDGEEPVCEQLQTDAAAMKDELSDLWRYLYRPEGKRDAIDGVWRQLEDRALLIDDFMPQSGLEDIDAVMREWSGTRERLSRFKRTMRMMAGDGATASN